MDKLETAALDGSLFNPHRSPSPARTLSPEPNTDDELGSDLEASHHASSVTQRTRRAAPQKHAAPSRVGGAQTGPKGVITDRKNQRLADRLAQETQRMQMIESQQKRALVGATSLQEDELRERERLLKETDEDGIAREQWRARRRAELEKEKLGDVGFEDADLTGKAGRGRGGLREVGMEGYLQAVERPGWAVILIYEPDVPRCNSLLASTLALALHLPPGSPLTLLRARATSLEFSLLPPIDPNDPEEEARPDKDVLPTLLAYKDGELQKTWIRVDWEVGEDGVEGLLRRYVAVQWELYTIDRRTGIITSRRILGGGRDDEDDD